MKHLSRSVAFLVLAGVAAQAHAQSGDEYQLDTPPAAAVSAPALTAAPAPLVPVAPATIPSAVIPAEQAPAPVVVIPAAEVAPAPVAAPVAKPVKVKPGTERTHAIPLINTKQHAQVHPDVTYITGGIGDDELQSIKATKANYNTYVLSASTTGAFVGDARVVITTKTGEVMLDAVAGPLLYAKLPAGSYLLDASLGEQKKHQAFTIGKKTGTANITLGWTVSAKLSN
ncbi:MAG: hypothetical protein V4735_01575 [Pseudomonadota bacterium]